MAAQSSADPLPTAQELFHCGQYVIVVGMSAEDRRINLTMRPSAVNAAVDLSQLEVGQLILGQVLSKEETGYSISFLGPSGQIDSTIAALPVISRGDTSYDVFLPADKCDREYVRGTPLLLAVFECKEGSVRVTALESEIRKATTNAVVGERRHITMEALRPGMLVRRGVVSDRAPDGSCTVSFLGLQGFVPVLHARTIRRDQRSLTGDESGTQTGAMRIISVDHSNNAVMLSALPSIVALEPYAPSGAQSGEFLTDLEIIRASDRSGLECLWRPPTAAESPRAPEMVVIPMSLISDSKRPELTDNHREGRVLPRARVIQPLLMDCVIMATTKASSLQGSVTGFQDIHVGDIVSGQIIEVLPSLGVRVRLAPAVVGLIPLRHLTDTSAGCVPPGQTAGSVYRQELHDPTFEVGKFIKCRVFDFDQPRGKVILTHRPLIMNTEAIWSSYEAIRPGDRSIGVLARPPMQMPGERRLRGGIVEFLGCVRGYLPPYGLPPLTSGGTFTFQADSIDGDRMTVRFVDQDGTVVALHQRSQAMPAPAPEIVPGSRVAALMDASQPFALELGAVVAFQPLSLSQCGMWLQGVVPRGDLRARVHITDVSDTLIASPFTSLLEAVQQAGQKLLVPAVVVQADPECVSLSLRESLLGEYGSALPPALRTAVAEARESTVQTRIRSIDDVVVGERYFGVVTNPSPVGVFVALAPHIEARVPLSEVSETFIPKHEVPGKLPPGTPVAMRVLSYSGQRLSATLREHSVAQPRRLLTYSELQEGEVLPATVRRVDSHGVFVNIMFSNQSLVGLCRPQSAVDVLSRDADPQVELQQFYKPGDVVVARIIGLKPESGRIEIGLKPSLFSEKELRQARKQANVKYDHVPFLVTQDMIGGLTQKVEEPQEDAKEEEEYEYEYEYSESVAEAQEDPQADIDAVGKTTLNWSTFNAPAGSARAHPDDSSSSSNEASEAESESDIEAREAALMDDNAAPVTAADFERELVGNADTADLWVKYISYYVQRAELLKARSVVERALRNVDASKEKEYRDVWLSSLLLEHQLGTDQTLQAKLTEALGACDPIALLPELAERITTCIARPDPARAAQLLTKLLRKGRSHGEHLRQSPAIWSALITTLFAAKKYDQARKAYEESLQSLTRVTDSYSLRLSYARSEFKSGDVERARSAFEALVADAPKRSDIWRQYIDMEISAAKAGDEVSDDDVARVRQLVQRADKQFETKSRVRQAFQKQWTAFIGDAEDL